MSPKLTSSFLRGKTAQGAAADVSSHRPAQSDGQSTEKEMRAFEPANTPKGFSCTSAVVGDAGVVMMRSRAARRLKCEPTGPELQGEGLAS